jgi:beta-hydroxylase
MLTVVSIQELIGGSARTGFLNPYMFDFMPRIEAGWRPLREEYLRLSDADLMQYPERGLHSGRWKVFQLLAYGKMLTENCERCPESTRMVQTIPQVFMAGFSCLYPGEKILPHRGQISDSIVRCHLGLVVPEGDCVFTVSGERRKWEEGKVLAFHDHDEHEVWNNTPHTRVVFLFDVPLPGTRIYEVSISSDVQSMLDSMPGQQIREIVRENPLKSKLKSVLAYGKSAATRRLKRWL